MAVKSCALNITYEKRELAERGTPLFPCGAYRTVLSTKSVSEIPWHWHEEIELLFVESGTALLELTEIGHTLRDGEGAFVSAGVLHSVKALGSDDCILLSFVFNPAMIYGFTESSIAQKYIRPLCNSALSCIAFYPETDWHRQALDCITMAFHSFIEEKYGFEFLVWEYLSHICYLISKNNQFVLEEQNRGEKQDSIRVKQMLSFIRQAYGEDLELKQIATASGISERECLRCFRAMLGIAPMQYLMKYRISVAARLLRETDESVTDICNRCGFSNPSYFSKIFKRYLESTPTAFRTGA